MDLDQQILDRLSNAEPTSGFRIFLPNPPPVDFYYKQKPFIPLPTKSFLPKPCTKLIQKKQKLFLTQVAPMHKAIRPSYIKVFSTCLKLTEEREYSEIMEVANWLKDVMFLYPMTNVRLKLLGKHMRSRSYRRAEYLYYENSPLSLFFVVLSGEVSILSNGKRVEIRSLRDIVGENAFIVKENFLFAARAITEVHALYIPISKFMEILGSDPLKSSINIMRILRDIDLFSNISIIKLLSLSNKLKPITVKKGSIIYDFNQVSDSLYILTHGLIQESIRISENFEEDKKIIKSGEYFGSRDLILAYPRRSSAVALVKSTVYKIPQKLFDAYFQEKFEKTDEYADYENSIIISRSYSRQPSMDLPTPTSILSRANSSYMLP